MRAKSAALALKELGPGTFAPGYLVFGEETHWHRQVIASIAASFPGGSETLAGDETTWEALRDLLAQPSFFGPQLWVVREAQRMFPDAGGRFVDGVAPGSCLVFSCDCKDNPAPRQFLEKWEGIGGRLIEAAEPSFAEASAWVMETFKQDGFKTTRDAVDSLVSITGRSIERLEQEIGKIEAYIGAPSGGLRSEVTTHIVAQCASQDPEKTAFGLIDAVSARNSGKAFSEYQDVRARGANPVMIISLLASHFGLIWRAKEAEMQGVSQSALPKALGVHPYPARKASQEAKRWTFGQLTTALYLMCTVDENIKRGRMDPDRAMDYLLSHLCRAQET